MRWPWWLIALLLLCAPAIAGDDLLFRDPDRPVQLERFYQQRWCYENGGKAEVVLPDKSRVDCVTATHAIECDFAHKWAEAIGQSLYYGIALKKKPGVVLIVGPNDNVYVQRFKAVAKRHRIKLWEVAE